MTEIPLRQVAFLDTNVLHYVDLYLREAKNRKLFPLNGDIVAARDYLENTIDGKLQKALVNGLSVIKCLLDKNLSVEYSSVSELELIVGRARGKAIEKAAAERIPDRMWTRLYDKEINDRLLVDDLRDIKARVEELGSLLQEAGVDVSVGRSDRARDVLEIAKDVAGIVYMNVIDSIIYAGALVADADQLISADEYLKKTANRIKNETSLKEARRQLEHRLAAVLSRELDTVTLPDASGITSWTP